MGIAVQSSSSPVELYIASVPELTMRYVATESVTTMTSIGLAKSSTTVSHAGVSALDLAILLFAIPYVYLFPSESVKSIILTGATPKTPSPTPAVPAVFISGP